MSNRLSKRVVKWKPGRKKGNTPYKHYEDKSKIIKMRIAIPHIEN